MILAKLDKILRCAQDDRLSCTPHSVGNRAMRDAVDLFLKTARNALDTGRDALFEHELYAVLAAAGLAVPRFVFVPRAGEIPEGSPLTQVPVVIKIVSKDILHKSDLGGVRFLEAGALRGEALAAMSDQVSAGFHEKTGAWPDIAGTLIAEQIPFDHSRLASELLLGLKWSADFGFVALAGLGGLKAELFASEEDSSRSIALFEPGRATPGELPAALRQISAYRDLAGELRGSRRAVDDGEWMRWTAFFSAVAEHFPPVARQAGLPSLVELEFNPVVASTSGRLVALDALARLSRSAAETPSRPLHKLKRFFQPSSIAIAGVSSKGVNMGRVILRNLLRDHFSSENLMLIKPGDREIDGVRCYAQPEELPRCADLAVLAVSAQLLPGMVEQLVRSRKAENIIAIPGGMAEKRGGEELQDRVAGILQASRSEDWQGPLVCGPNSMGVLSVPGGYDTTFIPESKFPRPQAPVSNVAYISQSGAFMLSRINNVPEAAPRYMVSAGNQMDLCISDYLHHLKDDPQVDVLAVYVEGFQQLDGARFLRESRQAIAAGKTVVLYKGGRSAEGQGAAAGHTASIAGEYRVARSLAETAGVLVAETHGEFEGCVRLGCLLRNKPMRGSRMALISNAGFQTVAMADNLHRRGASLELAQLGEDTLDRLRALLAPSGIDALINLGNPLDITPAAADEVYCECVRCLAEDPAVDAVIAAVVPFSPAMATLESSPHEHELITRPGSMARRLPELWARLDKPLLLVVEGGRPYDGLVRMLQGGGIPVFRMADEAMRVFSKYASTRLKWQGSPCPHPE